MEDNKLIIESTITPSIYNDDISIQSNIESCNKISKEPVSFSYRLHTQSSVENFSTLERYLPIEDNPILDYLSPSRDVNLTSKNQIKADCVRSRKKNLLNKSNTVVCIDLQSSELDNKTNTIDAMNQSSARLSEISTSALYSSKINLQPNEEQNNNEDISISLSNCKDLMKKINNKQIRNKREKINKTPDMFKNKDIHNNIKNKTPIINKIDDSAFEKVKLYQDQSSK